MGYLLDTNICIYLIKNNYPSVRRCFEQHPIDEVFLSTVTIYELFYGAEKSQQKERNRENLQRFCEQFTVIHFDWQAALKTAEIRCQLEQRGQVIGSYDLQIAGIALVNNMILVSNNLKEFSRVQNLRLENWLIDI